MDIKKKSRFNILDILIIITVAAIVTAIALRYDVITKVGLQSSSDDFDITFIVENIQQESEQYFTQGEQFIITKSLKPIGTLKEVLDVREAKMYVTTADGKIVKTDIPKRIDLTGVLSCKGRYTDDGYMIGGNQFVAPGKDFIIRSGNIEIMITVLAITDTKGQT